MSCGRQLPADDTGIHCLQNHWICSGECAQLFVKTVLGSPDDSIPLKCKVCKSDIVVETFERQLQPKESQIFLRYFLAKCTNFLEENEIVISCPFCDYWEINTKDEGMILFFCKNNSCKKGSCIFCHKNIPYSIDGDQLDEKEAEKHFQCAELFPYKKIWDDALSQGAKIPCPKCGVGGRKDNACTHMTCVKCKTLFCYVCGLDIANCDKEQGEDYSQTSLMPHHVNWKKNIQRCPMYLNEISEIDKRWPQENNVDDHSEACVEFLHQLRTKCLLKQAIKDIPKNIFKTLCDKYNIDKNNGYKIDDIMKNEHNLIQRK